MMMAGMDALLDIDWAAHWTGLVAARAAALGRCEEDFWDRRAAPLAADTRGVRDPFLDFIEPYLAPTRTLIDVGGGYGRHAVPLAERLDWVTVVEPSAGMRAQIPHVDNMTVIASSWQEAEVQPADLVICCHVLYPVNDPVPFLERLQQTATERVFVVLWDGPHPHPAEAMLDHTVPREPRLHDAFNLLRQLGVTPDVAFWRSPIVRRYPDLEQAVDSCRSYLGGLWDEERGRAWLAANLRREADGMLTHDSGETVAGVLHWRPGERG
jgi:hypothetical protein